MEGYPQRERPGPGKDGGRTAVALKKDGGRTAVALKKDGGRTAVALKKDGGHTAVVLEEDDFRARVDAIVGRDFFPDLRLPQQEGHMISTGAPVADAGGPSVSLDEFLRTHTSEDNASFSTLLRRENQMRRDQQAQRCAPAAQNRIAMAGGRNALMFAPDGVRPAAAADERRILHCNTRMPAGGQDDSDDDTVSVATTAGYMTPEINGYRMVGSRSQRRGFEIKPQTPRELAGLRLAQQGSPRTLQKARRPTTPQRRAETLSPAARKLLGTTSHQLGSPIRSRHDGDSLRRAYNSPYARRLDDGV
ncbi:hypothetical protein GGF46_002853 [Coemansia sp. RSA 552]|nr:hypothetical protein GGF46_002853 [Coemansia sp. RSA 552]